SVALAELGHKVAIVNPVARDNEQIDVTRANGLVIYRVGINSAKPAFRNKMLRKRMFSKAAQRGIDAAQADLRHFDVVHQHDYQNSTYAAAKARKSSAWVWTNHSSRFLRDFERPLKMLFIRQTYSNVSGVITVSDELLEKSKKLLPKSNITYIPNGVNTKLFHESVSVDRQAYGVQDQDLVVLCPRRMARKNGVIFLAQAVAQTIAKAPEIPWKFLFLGSTEAVNTDQSYIKEVKEILAPFEASGQVRFLGNIPMDKMPEVNALADIVMMPSLMEAVSLSALEGMASRKTLVVSEVGGLPEIVKHEQTGLLVPPKDPQAISEALVR